MNEQASAVAGQPRVYRGPLRTMWLIARHEGPLGLYKGFVPSYIRLGMATVLFLLAYECVH
jgi:hypothetical protein